MTILIQSNELGVHLGRWRDYKGDYFYKVFYGNELNNFDNFKDAMFAFNNCCLHASDCEGMD